MACQGISNRDSPEVPMAVAQWLLTVAVLYAAAGLLVGPAFVAWGVTRVDPAAKGSRWTFRLLILPGAAMLWPLIAARWWSRTRAAAEGGRS
jgi:hypothetical protein